MVSNDRAKSNRDAEKSKEMCTHHAVDELQVTRALGVTVTYDRADVSLLYREVARKA